jgi:hypothetical protein
VAILVVMGQVGIHPIVGSSVMVPVVIAGGFGLDPSVAVSTAVFAWGLNGSLSIWALPTAMCAAAFGVSSARLVSRRGVAYLFALGIAGIALLSAINAAAIRSP